MNDIPDDRTRGDGEEARPAGRPGPAADAVQAAASAVQAAADDAVERWRSGAAEPAWEALPPEVRKGVADRLLLDALTARALQGAAPADHACVDRALAAIRLEQQATQIAAAPETPAALDATTAAPALPYLSSVQPAEPTGDVPPPPPPPMQPQAAARVPHEPPRSLRLEDVRPRAEPGGDSSGGGRFPRGGASPWILRGAALAAAAALLIAPALWRLPVETTASAAVAKATEAAGALVDREYRVQAELRAAVPKTKWDAALYVRGGRQFAVRFASIAGDAWVGSDGEEAWIVPSLPVAPIRVSPNPRWLDAWLDDGRVDGVRPCLEISSLLERLAKHYALARLPDGPAPGGAPLDRLRIRADLRHAADGGHPNQVLVWIDPASGVVDRLEMRWADDAPTAVRSATFELVAAKPLPADWFRHSGHHSAHRPILSFP